MREEFERVGGGAGPQQLALRPGRRRAVPASEGGAVVTDAAGRAARRPSAARVRAGVPDVGASQRERRAPCGSPCSRPWNGGIASGLRAVGIVSRRRSSLTPRSPSCSSPSPSATRASRTTPTSSAGRWSRRSASSPSRCRGKRVLHVSRDRVRRRRVGDPLHAVPLMRDVGLDAEWQVIYGREEFFNATKLMHNALQGNPQDLTEEQWETWEQYNEMNARELSEGWDVCIVHDPQPAAMHSLVPGEGQGAGCGAATSTSRRRTRQTIERLLPVHRRLPARRCSTCASYVPAGDGRQRRTSSRRRSTRWRRRTWRCRPRTRRTSASSSASTSTAR